MGYNEAPTGPRWTQRITAGSAPALGTLQTGQEEYAMTNRAQHLVRRDGRVECRICKAHLGNVWRGLPGGDHFHAGRWLAFFPNQEEAFVENTRWEAAADLWDAHWCSDGQAPDWPGPVSPA